MHAIYFDRLPVELLHEIFSYFMCHEIFQSFYSISDYINSVIISYDSYLLDLSLEDIRKNEFDLICSIINLKQIVGLKLGKTRFNLANRYLNNIDDEQSLTRLRSLWLDKTISYDDVFSMKFNSKINYNNLISFRFDHIADCTLKNQSNCLFENLSRLVGCSSTRFRIFSNNVPTHLTFLHTFFNSTDDLCRFLHPNSHQLKSLGVGIRCELNNIDQFSSLFKNYQWTQLIQFNLNLQAMSDVRWLIIEKILSPMSRLKHLTLIFSQQTSVNSRLFNGIQWEFFVSTSLIYLKRFDLKLPVNEQSAYEIQNCLNTFRSSWWLNEKQWFIEYVYQQNALITVPYFATKVFDNGDLHSFDMMVNTELFYSNITELKINLVGSRHPDVLLISKDGNRPRFCHVTRLSLSGYLPIDIYDKIQHNVDMQIIKHFQLSSTFNHFHVFTQLIIGMRNLFSLHIQCMRTLRIFLLFSSPLFSIRRLVLFGYEVTTIKPLFSHLSRLFPRLTHLTTEYHSQRILRYLLNNLVHLEQINFRLNHKHHVPNHTWIKRHTRLMVDSFESEVFNVNYRERIFSIWINTDKNIDQSSRHKCPIQ